MNVIQKYYRIQFSRGVRWPSATMRIPSMVIRQSLQSFGLIDDGSSINGFGRYDLPLLASYSRSGTNWVRYFIEAVSGRATPGQVRLITGNEFMIDRAHRAFPIMHKHNKVVLIIRDYRECLIRHNRYMWEKNPCVEEFLLDENVRQPASWYIKNIRAFEEHSDEKLCLYYEDLISDPAPQFFQLASFLELDDEKVKSFIRNIDEHYRKSIAAYTSAGHTSESAKGKSLDHHAQSKLSKEQIVEFDDYYFNKYESLAEKYLTRYDTRNESLS